MVDGDPDVTGARASASRRVRPVPAAARTPPRPPPGRGPRVSPAVAAGRVLAVEWQVTARFEAETRFQERWPRAPVQLEIERIRKHPRRCRGRRARRRPRRPASRASPRAAGSPGTPGSRGARARARASRALVHAQRAGVRRVAAARAQTEPGRAHRAGADGPRERERRQAFLPALVTLGVPRQAALLGGRRRVRRARRVRRRRGEKARRSRGARGGHSARSRLGSGSGGRREPKARRERASRRECHRKHPDQDRAPGLSFRVRRSRFGARAPRATTETAPPVLRENLRHLRLERVERALRRAESLQRSGAVRGGFLPELASDQLVALQQEGGGGGLGLGSRKRRRLLRLAALALALLLLLGASERKDGRRRRRRRRPRPTRPPRTRPARTGEPLRAPRRRATQSALAARSRSFIILNCSNSSSNATVGAPGAVRRARRAARLCPSRCRVVHRRRVARSPRRRRELPRTPCAHRARSGAARAPRGRARARAGRPPEEARAAAPGESRTAFRHVRQAQLFRRSCVPRRSRRPRSSRSSGTPRPRRPRRATMPSPENGARATNPYVRVARPGTGRSSTRSTSRTAVLSTTLCVSLLPGRIPDFAVVRPASGASRPRTCPSRRSRARRAWGRGADRRVARVNEERRPPTRKRGRARGGGLLLLRDGVHRPRERGVRDIAREPTWWSDGDDRRDARRLPETRTRRTLTCSSEVHVPAGEVRRRWSSNCGSGFEPSGGDIGAPACEDGDVAPGVSPGADDAALHAPHRLVGGRTREEGTRHVPRLVARLMGPERSRFPKVVARYL